MIPRFRVWDDDNEDMVYGVGIDPNGIAYRIKKEDRDSDDFDYYPNGIVMQSTGLFDKNETEIFEGDVVNYKNSGYSKVEEVRFEQGAFIAGYHTGSSTRKRPKLIRGDRLEVIGNIYQDKELLGGK